MKATFLMTAALALALAACNREEGATAAAEAAAPAATTDGPAAPAPAKPAAAAVAEGLAHKARGRDEEAAAADLVLDAEGMGHALDELHASRPAPSFAIPRTARRRACAAAPAGRRGHPPR